jgi:uncharacterized protein YcfJ
MMVLEVIKKEIDMVTNLQTITAAIVFVFAFPAWAGHDNSRYSDTTYDTHQFDYAKVLDVQPIIETVQIPEDRQVCREVPVQRRVAEYRSPAPAIFGAILGGVIGNQLSRGHGHGHGHGYGHHGHGNNRAVATFAGAAIGGAIGTGIQYRNYPAKYYTENTQLCETQTSWRTEERVVAWDVSWKYRGRTYHSRMDEPPGERIRIRINVEPVYP